MASKSLLKIIMNNENYWCIDKNVIKILGCSATILFMEYITLHDHFKKKSFYWSRQDIDTKLNISRKQQYKLESFLEDLGLLKTRVSRSPLTRTLITINEKKAAKFLANPKKYIKKIVKTARAETTRALGQNDPTIYNYTSYTEIRNKNKKQKKDKNKFLSHSCSVPEQNHGKKEKKKISDKILVKPKKSFSATKKYPKVLITKPTKLSDPTKEAIYSKKAINAQDIMAYNELVKAGAMSHNKDTKTYSIVLDYIHSLLSPRCKNPWKKVTNEYVDKVWTVDELVTLFKVYLKAREGKYKDIKSFVLRSHGTSNPYSPLIYFYKVRKKEMERLDHTGYNGTGQRIMKFLDKKTNKAKEFQPGFYIRTGDLVDKLKNKYSGNPGLLAPENDLVYQFLQYVEDQLKRQTFKIPYICSQQFMDGFIQKAKETGSIVELNSIKH